MPDSSDNVNARDGASIVWGPEIRVDGKRPEDMGLRSFDKIDIPSTRGNKWYSEGTNGLGVAVANVFWPSVEKIRLLANHPHYAKAPTTPQLDPALWDRMVALVRGMVASSVHQLDGPWVREARAIVADLPKPVDPDLIEARRIASYTWQPGAWTDEQWERRVMEGSEDDDRAVQAAHAAIKRGRELAAPEVSHVG